MALIWQDFILTSTLFLSLLRTKGFPIVWLRQRPRKMHKGSANLLFFFFFFKCISLIKKKKLEKLRIQLSVKYEKECFERHPKWKNQVFNLPVKRLKRVVFYLIQIQKPHESIRYLVDQLTSTALTAAIVSSYSRLKAQIGYMYTIQKELEESRYETTIYYSFWSYSDIKVDLQPTYFLRNPSISNPRITSKPSNRMLRIAAR